MAATSGRKLHGRRAIRAKRATDGGRQGLSQSPGGGERRSDWSDRMRSSSDAPSKERGDPVAIAARSDAGTPRRTSVPVIEPADDPTMMSADLGSHPSSASSADSTPAWYACPTTPPAPSTKPTLLNLCPFGVRSHGPSRPLVRSSSTPPFQRCSRAYLSRAKGGLDAVFRRLI